MQQLINLHGSRWNCVVAALAFRLRLPPVCACLLAALASLCACLLAALASGYNKKGGGIRWNWLNGPAILLPGIMRMSQIQFLLQCFCVLAVIYTKSLAEQMLVGFVNRVCLSYYKPYLYIICYNIILLYFHVLSHYWNIKRNNGPPHYLDTSRILPQNSAPTKGLNEWSCRH